MRSYELKEPLGYGSMADGEGHGAPSSALVWEIPWTEEPGGLQSMGSRRVRHDWATSLSLFTFMHWRRQWHPTPVFLLGESQGQEPGGLPSMGLHRVGHDWRDLAAALWLIISLLSSCCAVQQVTAYKWPFVTQVKNTGNGLVWINMVLLHALWAWKTSEVIAHKAVWSLCITLSANII